MPNWCTNSVVVYGKDKNELELFKERYEKAYRAQKENKHWGTYELFVAHNYDGERVLEGDYDYIRGPIYECGRIKYDDGDFWLSFEFESAWSPMIDGLRTILDKNYKTLRMVVMAEECGCDLYINTDEEHRFFKDKYCTYDDDKGSEYFTSDGELIKYMKEEFGYDIEDVDALEDDDEFEIDDDDYHSVSFHRFTSW